MLVQTVLLRVVRAELPRVYGSFVSVSIDQSSLRKPIYASKSFSLRLLLQMPLYPPSRVPQAAPSPYSQTPRLLMVSPFGVGRYFQLLSFVFLSMVPLYRHSPAIFILSFHSLYHYKSLSKSDPWCKILLFTSVCMCSCVRTYESLSCVSPGNLPPTPCVMALRRGGVRGRIFSCGSTSPPFLPFLGYPVGGKAEDEEDRLLNTKLAVVSST